MCVCVLYIVYKHINTINTSKAHISTVLPYCSLSVNRMSPVASVAILRTASHSDNETVHLISITLSQSWQKNLICHDHSGSLVTNRQTHNNFYFSFYFCRYLLLNIIENGQYFCRSVGPWGAIYSSSDELEILSNKFSSLQVRIKTIWYKTHK